MIDLYEDPALDDDWGEFHQRYQRASEDDPYLLVTTGSTFGGPDDQEDNGEFAFGGGSTLPDGTLNPENYAAFPASLYEKGLVQPGQKIRVKNPTTGAVTIVIARDKGPSAKNRGIDLAPHALMELGANTDDPLVVDFRPITDIEEQVMQPFSLSALPDDMSLSDISPPDPNKPAEMAPLTASAVFNPSMQGISELTSIGSKEPSVPVDTISQPFTPNQSIVDSAPSSRQPQTPMIPKVVKQRDDGAVEWSDGRIVHPSGIVEYEEGGEIYHDIPGKGPRRIPSDTEATQVIQRVGEDGVKRNVLINKKTGADIKDLGANDLGGLTEPQKLAVKREVKKDFRENPTTISMYGKGQMPGLHQIKTRIDALYNSVGGDYSKMNPQDLATLVFAFGKFNDPNSAVLLGEYQAAASRAGLGDRAMLALERAQRGDPISVQQARDINQTINTAYAAFKEMHFQDLRDREEELKVSGVGMEALVPINIRKEYEGWKKVMESGGTPEKEVRSETSGKPKLKKGAVVELGGKRYTFKGGDPDDKNNYEAQ